MQALLASWPNSGQEQVSNLFDSLYQRYLQLRDHIAAVGYVLPNMLLGRFQN
jgi:hypothetical protein